MVGLCFRRGVLWISEIVIPDFIYRYGQITARIFLCITLLLISYSLKLRSDSIPITPFVLNTMIMDNNALYTGMIKEVMDAIMFVPALLNLNTSQNVFFERFADNN